MTHFLMIVAVLHLLWAGVTASCKPGEPRPNQPGAWGLLVKFSVHVGIGISAVLLLALSWLQA